jgi:hypothetical protein
LRVRHASSSARRYSNGLNWTWLTTGGVLAMAITCPSPPLLKFETSIERAYPRSRAASIPGHAQA